MVATSIPLAKPVREIGAMFAMSAEVFARSVRPPFAWREFVDQCWFVARVSATPAVAMSIALNGLVVFILNILLIELGAADLSGVGTAIAVISQSGPFCTALVCSGAAATAMCADLGARTIREELDAMETMGISPIQRLAVPRVTALLLNALLLNGLVCTVGVAGCYTFAVFVQNVSPGSFVASLTLLLGVRDVVFGFVKAALFGLVGGLIACYKGFHPGSGPAGVGNAVNETVVYTLLAMAAVNTLVTSIAAIGAS